MTFFDGLVEFMKALAPVLEAVAWPATVAFAVWWVGRKIADALATAISQHSIKLKHKDSSFESTPRQLPSDPSRAAPETVAVTSDAMGIGVPTIAHAANPAPTPTPTPTQADQAADPPELADTPKVEIVKAVVHWHCMYLSAFLRPHTIGVLIWLEANGATSKGDLRDIWRPTIQDLDEFEAVMSALESNQLIELANSKWQVTAKGCNYLAWRSKERLYPTSQTQFELAPKSGS